MRVLGFLLLLIPLACGGSDPGGSVSDSGTGTGSASATASATDGMTQPTEGGGSATAGGCAPGLVLCDGACIDIAADANNCGGCGNSCDGGGTCSLGNCVQGCPVGAAL